MRINFYTISKLAIVTLALLLSVTSCDDAEYKVLDNAIYLSEASGISNSRKITIDDLGGVATISVRAKDKVDHDVEAQLIVDPLALEKFNERNGTNYQPLPEELYSFSTERVTIEKGNISAPTVSVNLKGLTEDLVNSGNQFALPITFKVAGNENILESAKDMVYILDQVFITSVPVLTGNRPAKLNMRQDYDINAWSLEMRVNMSELGTGIGQMNNQAIFAASPGESRPATEGEIYIRFGDAPIKGNILQIKTQGTQINSNTEFSAQKWYHLAFVSDGVSLKLYIDGKLDVTLALPNIPMHLDKESFMLCGSGSWLRADVMLSEVRFWTKAISQNQIQNNAFVINPQTDGLEGYWKMNEGEGTTFKDATGNGNTGEVQGGSITWVDGIRSDGK